MRTSTNIMVKIIHLRVLWPKPVCFHVWNDSAPFGMQGDKLVTIPMTWMIYAAASVKLQALPRTVSHNGYSVPSQVALQKFHNHRNSLDSRLLQKTAKKKQSQTYLYHILFMTANTVHDPDPGLAQTGPGPGPGPAQSISTKRRPTNRRHEITARWWLLKMLNKWWVIRDWTPTRPTTQD
jgi:hypothetical protein